MLDGPHAYIYRAYTVLVRIYTDTIRSLYGPTHVSIRSLNTHPEGQPARRRVFALLGFGAAGCQRVSGTPPYVCYIIEYIRDMEF